MDNFLQRINQIDLELLDNSLVTNAEKLLTDQTEVLFLSENRQKDVESRINTSRIKIQQSESSLYSGKINNPKELQDLQSEIALLKKHVTVLEEEQFNDMLVVEENLHTKQSLADSLLKTRNMKETADSQLRAEKQNLEKEITTLQTERDALLKTIEPDVLVLYKKIRISRKGIAVTQIVENTCEKCGAEITQEEWQKARISMDLCFCSTCGRILYAK